MAEATITSKGQVTIPKKSIEDLKGILHRPGQKKVTVEEMNEGIKEAALDRYKRSL